MRALCSLTMRPRSVGVARTWILSTSGALLVAACGGAPAAPQAAPASTPAAEAAPAAPAMSEVQKKLQGTWEIVRYESDRPIPKEAMPVMGEMFEALRLRFEGASATFQIGKTTEKLPYDVAEESDAGFKLVAKGGMFDGAACKFVGDDQWEVTDKGERWPGVTLLRRVR